MTEPQTADFEVTLQTLNYATRLLASELDTGRLLDRALDTLADFGRSRRLALLSVQEDGALLEVAGELSRQGLVDPDRLIPYPATPLQGVIESRQPGTFGLVPGDTLPLPTEDGGVPEKECLCLPLIGSQNRTIAVAVLERERRDPLSELDRQALKVVTTLISVSLENARLFRLATVDGLTDLYVRRFFEIRLGEEIARVCRYGGPLALLMTDIDHFKLFNDRYGHQMGDRVLRELADVLRGALRRGVDVACRYGGEEFVTILPATDLIGAHEVAERVRRQCEEVRFQGPDGPLQVTVSGGFTAMDGSSEVSAEEFVRRADAALYRAKDGGRNRMLPWEEA